MRLSGQHCKEGLQGVSSASAAAITRSAVSVRRHSLPLSTCRSQPSSRQGTQPCSLSPCSRWTLPCRPLPRRGQGLSSEVMGSAFVPFYSTKEKGSGLGLPLCREIVEAHGGRLRLQNRAGGGAEIVVRLPARDTTGDDFRVKLTLTRG